MAKKRTRALCVCNGGNVRSVTLARMLRHKGWEAIACGVDQSWSDATILHLVNWCEVIFIQRDAAIKLGERPPWKVTDESNEKGASFVWTNGYDTRVGYMDYRFDVGKDDWLKPDDPDLRRRLRALYEAQAG